MKTHRVCGESCIFGDTQRASLLFAPCGQVTLRHSLTGEVYEEGRDFRVDAEKRLLERLPGSRIPLFPLTERYPAENVRYYPDPDANAVGGGPDGKNVRFDAKLFFASRQAEAEYETGSDFPADLLPRSPFAPEGKTFRRMTSLGDSITEGYNASAYVGQKPFRKPYAGLTADHLHAELLNLGKNGASCRMLRDLAEKTLESRPDLLTIAFGMNDLCALKPEEYIQEIHSFLLRFRPECPDCTVVLVSPMTGNPEWQWTPPDRTMAFAGALKEYAEAQKLVFADVCRLWRFVLERKDFFSLTGNGVNHPNDYGHRLYSEVILRALGC